MIERELKYEHDGTTFDAYVALKEGLGNGRPAVLIAHTWEGRGEFVCDKARVLAGEGYVACAIDLYGDARTGADADESAQLMQPLLDDRGLLQSRLLRALQAIASIEEVDPSRIAAIGYCFGGLCVLDLARIGGDVRGVVSFHGLLTAPQNIAAQSINAKVLILHGHEDPMAKIDDVLAIENELTAARADWQLHSYGNTMHSFTNPNANNPDFGTVYNDTADYRSWIAMMNFLGEVLQ